MFDNIYCDPHGSSQTTKAIVDGSDVRYTVMFASANDGSACMVLCSVYLPGVTTDAVAQCGLGYGDRMTTF